MLKRWSWFTLAALLVTGMFSVSVRAEEASGGEAGLDLTLRSNAAAQPIKTADGSALESPASHVYLMDFNTGAVLADKAGELKMYPSSMTKMMTLYIIFEKLKEGTLSLDSQFTVSRDTWVKWNNRGSSMFLPINSQVSLEDLIRGIAIQSGNDACVVAAEGILGSEEKFAAEMNATAKKLGMNNSNFSDSTGWPNPEHTTTPHDLAVLGAALIRDFPQYYHYLSEREFTFHNIRQFNRNLLLNNPSLHVDGLKTGHTDAAGYGITVSATDNGRRLVLVVNGLNSEAERASEAERLIKWGLQNFEDKPLFAANKPLLQGKVWMGTAKEVPLGVANSLQVTLPKNAGNNIKITASYDAPLVAPVEAGKEVGTVTVTLPNGTTQQTKLVTLAAVPKLGFFARIPRALGL